MGFVLIGDDGTDADAPARREAARAAHVGNIHAHAAAGRLVMSGPRMPNDDTTTGSLQFFEVPDMAAMEDYLAAEPFVAEGVWRSLEVLPFRIAPVAWPPQPGRPGGSPTAVFSFAVIARDGTDEGAVARRIAVRQRHLARMQPEVAAGRLRFGGAILDAPEGDMIGSIIALDLPDEAAVRDWLADDPYTREGVWQAFRIERWRIGAQPYPPLPGAA